MIQFLGEIERFQAATVINIATIAHLQGSLSARRLGMSTETDKRSAHSKNALPMPRNIINSRTRAGVFGNFKRTFLVVAGFAAQQEGRALQHLRQAAYRQAGHQSLLAEWQSWGDGEEAILQSGIRKVHLLCRYSLVVVYFY